MAFVTDLEASQTLLNKAQAAHLLRQVGYSREKIAEVIGLPVLLSEEE